MSVDEKFKAVPDVDIDPDGRFKYVLIKVYSGQGDDFKHIVRGYTWAGYHGMTCCQNIVTAHFYN